MKLYKLFIFSVLCIFLFSCKKTNPKELLKKQTSNRDSDTLYIDKEKGFITFKWDEKEIQNYKKTFQNEEDFYTIMDDVNYYTAESIGCLEKSKIEKIEVDKSKYKVLALDNDFIKIDTLKFFDLILFEKGKHYVIKKPIDTQLKCLEYYSIKSEPADKGSIESFTPKNYHILSKAFYDWDGDKIKDAVIVYDSIPSGNWQGKGKRPLIGLKGNSGQNFTFWFRNDEAIPCRNCAGSADPIFELKTEKGDLKYNDISLSSSIIKNAEYTFDKNLNLNNVNVSIEDGVSQKNNKSQISIDKLAGINLKNFNIKQFEDKFINYFMVE